MTPSLSATHLGVTADTQITQTATEFTMTQATGMLSGVPR